MEKKEERKKNRPTWDRTQHDKERGVEPLLLKLGEESKKSVPQPRGLS